MSTQLDLFPAPSYPDAPGSKAPGTSAEAAAEIGPERAKTLRDGCLAYLRLVRPSTADEVADAMGESWASIRPRISELKALNQITDTGKRRRNQSGKNAVVWRAV